MLPLAELQRQIAAFIHHSDPESADGVPPLPEGLRHRLQVHQQTVLQTLINALRLTFPTILQLSGESGFCRLATEYALRQPARSPHLHCYGADFPRFLASPTTVGTRPCFHDAACFDWAVEQARQDSPEAFGRVISMAVHVKLRLATSLRCLRLNYAVDLDMHRAERHIAIWRHHDGVSVKVLSAPAAEFLRGLLDGQDAAISIDRALTGHPAEDALKGIFLEVLMGSFAWLTPPPRGSVWSVMKVLHDL